MKSAVALCRSWELWESLLPWRSVSLRLPRSGQGSAYISTGVKCHDEKPRTYETGMEPPAGRSTTIRIMDDLAALGLSRLAWQSLWGSWMNVCTCNRGYSLEWQCSVWNFLTSWGVVFAGILDRCLGSISGPDSRIVCRESSLLHSASGCLLLKTPFVLSQMCWQNLWILCGKKNKTFLSLYVSTSHVLWTAPLSKHLCRITHKSLRC